MCEIFDEIRQKGKLEGFFEGEQKGKLEGFFEGEQKGKLEGMAEGKLELIKQLMNGQNLSFDDAMNLIGITKEEQNTYRKPIVS